MSPSIQSVALLCCVCSVMGWHTRGNTALSHNTNEKYSSAVAFRPVYERPGCLIPPPSKPRIGSIQESVFYNGNVPLGIPHGLEVENRPLGIRAQDSISSLITDAQAALRTLG